ncbi:MAG: M23 family metallopeptidase [Flavobacteriaceae bacterium]
MRFIVVTLFFLSAVLKAQNPYPQDYFTSPLEIPLILSGTFAELRSNHFHSGLDIKTQQRVGLKVKAAANGFVSRIKVSHFGYGKALYITHPNGYTTVYAHLQKFSPTVEAYVKKQQYEQETYEIELFPNAEALPVTQNELVAYSGNSGGSGGPHLHFEVRDKTERPINPMLFGYDIKDSSKPYMKTLYAYPLTDSALINASNQKQLIRIVPLENGDYTTENISAYGAIGFGIETNDRQDLAANANGVYNIQTFFNGNKNFELDFSLFSFDESRHINQLIDYEIFNKSKKRIQKLFVQNNPLSLYKSATNSGFLNIKDSTHSVYKIRVTDFKNNDAWLTINIDGKKDTTPTLTKPKITPYYIHANQNIDLKSNNVTVNFYPDTFYNDFYMDFEVKNDTLTLHDDTMPAKKGFNITYNIEQYKTPDKSKLFIARLSGYKKNIPVYSTTKRMGDTLSTSTKTLGTYTLMADTQPPTIFSPNFKEGQWISNFNYLSIKISDDLSGISNYRATVNGTWILMEYDYKTKTLTHNFNDGVVSETKNNFKLIVTDNVGNSTTFESTFHRK